MKKLLTILAFCAATFNISAQVLSEAELANVNSENITAMEQMKLDSENAFKGRGIFVTVGNDSSCDYYTGNTRIQDAIDAGNVEIRIAQGTYNENVVIDDKDAKLLGGYSSCSTADNDNYSSNQFAIIQPNAGSGQPAIKITGNNSRNSVIFRNLNMLLGESKGGLAIRDADLYLEISNSVIANNNGDYGGGLSVVNGNTDIATNNLQIILNNASVVGGGLYCKGPNNSIIMTQTGTSPFSIAGNNAINGNGGGAYVSDGCQFTSYVGDDNSSSGIANNKATGNGGGLYAASGAKVYLNGNRYCASANVCYGNNDKPVNFSGNKAHNDQNNSSQGGAIYATGTSTAIYGNNLKVNLNEAFSGTAAMVVNDALFQTQTTYDNGFYENLNPCWSKGRCNQFVENNQINNNGGGAFRVETGGQLKITRTHIEGHYAFGSAVFKIKDSGSSLDLEGSYVTGNGKNGINGNNYPIGVSSGASARIAYTTIADNFANAAGSTVVTNASHLKIYSSIIHDLSGARALIESNPISSEIDCLIVNRLGDINDPRSIVADPEFIDRNNNDFHINAALSPAVDYCDDTNTQSNAQDTDRENRGWDDYSLNNINGPYDVGADETYANDIIFEDEFD